MENMNENQYRHYMQVYDNTGDEALPNFLDLVQEFTRHVNNEEDLVIPLLDYLGLRIDGITPEIGNLKDVAREFSNRLDEMRNEHESAKLAAQRMAELAKATQNKRAFGIWTGLSEHMQLEERALRLAESTAKSILLSQ